VPPASRPLSASISGRARAGARALRVLPEALLGVAAPRARPVHMHLEHTTRCDHVCSTCIRAVRIDGEEDMPLDEARGYLDAVAPRFLSLNGIGEPLLHPDWDAIARHAIEGHGASVGMATTGTHFRAQARRLVESGVGLLKVSFHGAKPRTFARLASGRELALVEDGVRALFAERSRAGRGPQVRINYVVSEESYAEIPDAVEVAAAWGVPAVYFKGALVPEGRNAGLAGEHDRGRLKEAVLRGLRIAEERAVDTNLAHWKREIDRVGAVAKDERAPPDGRCLIPWLSVFVRIDGTVLPCCNCTFHPDEGRMGRIGAGEDAASFEEIWRGERLQALRAEMRDGRYSLRICQDCPDPVTLPQLAEAGARKMWPGFVNE
jgi:MoaA/NifB/PqqE/SkfB family radical SAM enzyme